MANSIDFISSVYDLLAKTFAIDSSQSDHFLQMAWPGLTISPADFKPPNQPNGPYDPDIAERTFSSIANIIPTFDKIRFENSGFEVDDLYELLIAGAIPVGADPNNIDKNPLYKLFSDANFEFINSKKGSKIDANDFYYPCIATPINWYDENASSFWPSINISSGDIKPATSQSLFIKFGGNSIIDKGLWKIKPSLIDEVAFKTKLSQALSTKVTSLNLKPITKNEIAKPLEFHLASTIKTANISSSDTNKMRTSAFISNLNSARTSQLFTNKMLPTNIFSLDKTKAIINNSKLNKSKLTLDLPKSGLLGDTMIINSFLNQNLDSKPVSNTTNGFSISFKFCRVNISRPWLKLGLLNTKNWYMFGTNIGEYSTGDAVNNPGMFPFLPNSFIVISNLKISANWSQEDKTNFSNSTSFGPFDIRNSSFSQNTIEAKGMQVIGWISKLMPILPPSKV